MEQFKPPAESLYKNEEEQKERLHKLRIIQNILDVLQLVKAPDIIDVNEQAKQFDFKKGQPIYLASDWMVYFYPDMAVKLVYTYGPGSSKATEDGTFLFEEIIKRCEAEGIKFKGREQMERSNVSEYSEEFDPEVEWEKIKKAPHDRGKWDDFKEKLTEQKRGLASMQDYLIGTFRKDPDISVDQVFTEVDKYACQYNFSFEQKIKIKQTLLQFERKHLAVRKARKDYPNDQELFSAVFGQMPKGKVEVAEGPIILHFRLHNPDDYIFAYNYGFSDQQIAADAQIKRTKGVYKHGVPPLSNEMKNLTNCISIENYNGLDTENVFIHEEQHAFYIFFGSVIKRCRNSIDKNLQCINIFDSQNDEDKLEKAMTRHFRFLRNEKDIKIKNEILAYLKEEKDQFRKNWSRSRLKATKEDGGLYDWFAELKKELSDSLKEHIGSKYGDLIQKKIKEVFEEEYNQLIDDCFEAFDVLLANGFSVEEATALLIKEPFYRWKKETHRQLALLKKKKAGGIEHPNL